MLWYLYVSAKGIDHFASLNDNLAKQLEYVYDVINEDPSLRDITKVLTASRVEQKSTDLDKAEESKMLRNKGNSAYAKKQLQVALAHYSQSTLQAPLKSREAALSLGNR